MAENYPQTVGSGAIVDGFNSLTVVRQIGLMIGLAASVAIGFGVVLWSKQPDFRVVSGNVSNLDAVELTTILGQQNIKYKVDLDKGVLMVDADQVHQARLALAAAGLPSGAAAGYEILDKESQLGTSQFMERARYHRSIEGELAKTISNINSIKAARVHLAIPKRTVFIGDTRDPSASVFVDLYPGAALEKQQIASIVHLVASSIPQLSNKKVTVIDQKGRLLSGTDANTDIAMAAKNLDYLKNVEDKYRARVMNILSPILGDDRFNVQISADIDFTQLEQTAESFNPDLPALRSEQMLREEQGGGAGAIGVPGALSNQPPAEGDAPEVAGEGAAAQAAEGSAGNARTQSTRNFELDRTISYTKHQMGVIQKLSVAVVVDNKPGTSSGEDGEDEDGVSQGVPLTEEEIKRIETLVQNAVGYNATRGDSVSVINQAFIDKSVKFDIPEVPFYEQDWVMGVGKAAAGWLLVLILIMGVLRPILRGLAANASNVTTEDELEEISLDAPQEMEEMVTLSGGPESLLPGPDEGYEQQLTAIKGMVAEDPRRVAQAIKTWISNET